MMTAVARMARLKVPRGSPFDLFGRTEERRLERRLIAEYHPLIDQILRRMSLETDALEVALASIAEHIRDHGPIKARHVSKAKARGAELLE